MVVNGILFGVMTLSAWVMADNTMARALLVGDWSIIYFSSKIIFVSATSVLTLLHKSMYELFETKSFTILILLFFQLQPNEDEFLKYFVS